MGTLDGLKVIDASTLLAGPTAATLLADHGAEVIKIEHPNGDAARFYSYSKNNIGLWWKVVSRNKKLVAIDLHDKRGQEIVKMLIKNADVFIENFRPGKLDEWGLGFKTLMDLNPKLIILAISGFGQTGPYSKLPGFGTLAEAMSGFAHVTGEKNGPPTLPPFALADGIAGITGAFAVMAAIYKREQTGKGEIIDLALYEPLMWIIETQIVVYDQLRIIQTRHGNISESTCPRNAYKTKDNRWVALSASANNIAYRLFKTIGREDLITLYPTNRERLKHREEIDSLIQEWIGQRTQEEVIKILRDAEVAVAPIYDAEQIYNDEHFRYRKSIITVDDEDFGKITMQGIFPKFENNPGSIRHTGRSKIGYDTDTVLKSLGFDDAKISELRREGVIK